MKKTQNKQLIQKQTQRLDKVKTGKVRDPNSKLVTNGPEAQI